MGIKKIIVFGIVDLFATAGAALLVDAVKEGKIKPKEKAKEVADAIKNSFAEMKSGN